MRDRGGPIAQLGDILTGLGAKRFGLSFVSLVLILALVSWLRPNVASYNGLRLLLNLSPDLVFTALAQMFIMTAGDIDLGIRTFVGLVDCIVAGMLNDQPALALVMLIACPMAYG